MACGVILAPKWPNFDQFHKEWYILTKLTQLMTFLTIFMSIILTEIILTKFMSTNLIEIIFKIFREKIIWPLSLNFGLWRQNELILTIFTKNDLFRPNWPLRHFLPNTFRENVNTTFALTVGPMGNYINTPPPSSSIVRTIYSIHMEM